ncbi:MAG TPA: cyclic nucleotide-binding domain-containing protein [Micromonosporaceae bacterium]|nr:cyclic nucleotide-binding domain-containing protein [Micromonosporaceae bacterium]
MTAYELLAAHPFCAGLTDRQVDRLSTWARRSLLHAGERVFDEGGRADRFWLIHQGRVALDTRLGPDRYVVLDSLGAGTVLGWSWLFPPYRWHFGAVAVQPTVAVEVDGPGVRELCEADPVLGYQLLFRFMVVVVQRMQATRLRLLDPQPTHV